MSNATHRRAVPTIIYELETVAAFCDQVALVRALQEHTQVRWVENHDSVALDTAYNILFWKERPGAMEVEQSSRRVIQRRREELKSQYLKNWVRAVSAHGGGAGNRYIDTLLKVRDEGREALTSAAAEAQAVNRQVAEQLRGAIQTFAFITLAGTVGIAVASVGAATGILVVKAGELVWVGGIGIAYSVSTTLIKTFEGGGSAKAVAIATGKAAAMEASKEKGGKVIEAGAEKATMHAKAMKAAAGRMLADSEDEIRRQAARLVEKNLSKEAAEKALRLKAAKEMQAQLAKRSIEAGAKTTGRAAAAKFAATRFCPVVFAALDTWGAIQDYNETLDEL